VTLEDVEDVSDPVQSVKPGLISDTDSCLPLKSVHVRAKLVDLAAQVCQHQSSLCTSLQLQLPIIIIIVIISSLLLHSRFLTPIKIHLVD